MSNIQVFHMQKRVTISGGLNRHITRVQWEDGKNVVWVPKNANPNLTKNNIELVSREVTNSEGNKRTLSLQQAVNRRLEDAGIKPRKGQNRSLEIIFSGSHDVLAKMERKEVLSWANDSVEWAKKTWGKENVVSASLHLDEKTPHIHMIVVPIVQGQSRRTKNQRKIDKERGLKKGAYNINNEKLRLCCNEVYTTPLLYEYHDKYAEEVSNKYGLVRGLRAEPGSKKKHQSSEDYNRQLAAEAAEKKSIIADIQSDYKKVYKKKEDLELEIKNLERQSSFLSEEISDQDDQLMCYEQQLEIYREIGTSIENRQEQLRALSARGLKKLIEDIPDMIKKDVQILVSKVWKGEVISFEEFDDKVGGVPQKFVRIHMLNGDRKYELEVQESNGHVWKDGKWCTYRDNTEIIMPELASYFRQELLPETKDFIKSMYKVKNEQEVVWECKIGIYDCRIVTTPDNNYHLQKLNLNRQWETTQIFTRFKELKRDNNYAYLKILQKNGKAKIVDQYGNEMPERVLRKLELSQGGGGVSR